MIDWMLASNVQIETFFRQTEILDNPAILSVLGIEPHLHIIQSLKPLSNVPTPIPARNTNV